MAAKKPVAQKTPVTKNDDSSRSEVVLMLRAALHEADAVLLNVAPHSAARPLIANALEQS